MSTSLTSIFWHDGQLKGLSFGVDSHGQASVTVSVAIYESEQAPTRKLVSVSCIDVSRFQTTLDVRELKDNARAGNIEDGHLRKGKLYLSLTGGSIEIDAKEFTADAC
jgi:hypothetical protein